MIRLFLVITLLFSFGACAHVGKSGQGQPLEDRIVQFAEARIQGDWALLYDMSNKDYKTIMSKDRFTNMERGMTYVAYSIEDVRENGPDSGEALVLWDFQAGGYNFSGKKDRQKWVREDGVWNFVMPQDTKFGFKNQKADN